MVSSTILLSSDPPVGASELVSESAFLSGEWTLQIEVEREGVPLSGTRATIGFARGAPLRAILGADGWRIATGDRRRPTWVELAPPASGVAPRRFPVVLREANSLRFQLVPPSRETIDFHDERLAIGPGVLSMRRHGATLTYKRRVDPDG